MQTLNPLLSPILSALDRYLDLHPATNEHCLIKHLQSECIPPFEHFQLSQAKDLFSAHFLCMHALYHLKTRYAQEERYALLIHAVRVERVAFQSVNHNTKSDTQLHLAQSDPLAAYYLNPKHYFETQESEITDMLTTFWKKYLAQDEKQASLKTLGLPNDANAHMLKQQYRRLAQKHHPDKGGCAKRFNEIQAAKELLERCLS